MEKSRNFDDPWGLLDKELSSRHCEGKKAIIIGYDHIGCIWASCECGEKYQHDQGAYAFQIPYLEKANI